MLSQRDGDGRRDVEVGAAEVLDDGEELDQVEPRHRDEGGALAQREIEQDRHPVDVEERQHGQDAIRGIQVHVRHALGHVRHEVAVAEHHALGDAGRARRVREDGDVRRRVERDLGRRALLHEQLTEVRVTVGPLGTGAVQHDQPRGRDAPRCRCGLGLGEQR